MLGSSHAGLWLPKVRPRSRYSNRGDSELHNLSNIQPVADNNHTVVAQVGNEKTIHVTVIVDQNR